MLFPITVIGAVVAVVHVRSKKKKGTSCVTADHLKCINDNAAFPYLIAAQMVLPYAQKTSNRCILHMVFMSFIGI